MLLPADSNAAVIQALSEMQPEPRQPEVAPVQPAPEVEMTAALQETNMESRVMADTLATLATLASLVNGDEKLDLKRAMMEMQPEGFAEEMPAEAHEERSSGTPQEVAMVEHSKGHGVEVVVAEQDHQVWIISRITSIKLGLQMALPLSLPWCLRLQPRIPTFKKRMF